MKDFTATVFKDNKLPAYVKHYPILNPPVNTMIGELTKRPDVHRVRAFDDNSRAEELEYKTDILQQIVLQGARQVVMNKMALQGQDVSQMSDQDMQQLTYEQVKDDLLDYTSLAEKWGNHMLTALKATFNTKEKSEDAFRDLLLTSREFFHIFEDTSKLGFNIETLNPKNEWHLGTPDSKYISGVSGEQSVPYANGTVHVMEISEIIEKFSWLTKDEIDHLRTSLQDFGLINVRESNLFTNETGIESVKYDTYNKLVLEERMMVEAEMKENKDELRDWLGLTNNTTSFGYKYTVVRSYWISKKKIGKLTYIDENGDEQTTLVDENYKKGSPGEMDLEWGWINQWYQGVRIGPDIYYLAPFKLLDYSPIIGLVHEIKNTTPKSLVDLMKPLQVLYNVCMNQLWELLNKEIGNVAQINLRRIPRPKDGDQQDAIDVWEEEARKRGVMWDDDSPENTQAPVSNTTIARNVDLTRSNEIQSRYNLAIALKQECWELVGMNKQRLGESLATQTATANQSDLAQSFAQTEPYFASHDYILNQVYQALLDAAQYIESNKPLSTINYISTQGEAAYIQISGDDLKLRDLKCFVTSRPEDQQLFQEFRQLSQAALQNGASLYEISQMYTTNSLRQMQKMLKDLKEKNDEMQSQQQQLEQQTEQAKAEAEKAKIDQAERFHQDNVQMEKYKTDVQANTALGVAEIKNYFQEPADDADGNGVPDPMDVANHQLKLQESIQARDLENKRISLEMQKFMAEQQNHKEDVQMEKEKLKEKGKDRQSKEKIARMRPKPSSSSKSKKK
jgi:hypothetical protein